MIRLPTTEVWLWLAPFLVAALLSVLGTPIAIRLAKRFRVIDQPVGGKIHKRPTPLLGGLAVYAAFAIACVLFLPLGGPVLGIVLGGALAVSVGVIDDKVKLSPLVHLGGQTLAALVTITGGVGIVKSISNPFASGAMISQGHGSWQVPTILGLVFTAFWIVGMMNTVNFLDGLDGLSTGVGSIAAILLAVWAAQNASTSFRHEDLVLPVILAAGLLGFLPFNWNPARVFIGDSGALFIGLALGALSIIGPAKIGTALLVLVIPVLDVAWAIVRRRWSGRSFLTGDKKHVYHRMLELGISPTSTVLWLYALCAALALIDLFLAKLVKLIAFVLILMLTSAGFVRLEVLGIRRDRLLQVSREDRGRPAAAGTGVGGPGA